VTISQVLEICISAFQPHCDGISIRLRNTRCVHNHYVEIFKKAGELPFPHGDTAMNIFRPHAHWIAVMTLAIISGCGDTENTATSAS
jgi:hypothetical protein